MPIKTAGGIDQTELVQRRRVLRRPLTIPRSFLLRADEAIEYPHARLRHSINAK